MSMHKVFGIVARPIGVFAAGADTFVWLPGQGNDVVDGGNGEDTMAFRGAPANEKMSLAASSKHAVFSRDVASIQIDMNNIETFNLQSLGGADEVTVNDLRGTDIRHTNIDLSAPAGGGDEAADSVVVNGTNQNDHVAVTAQAGSVDVDGLKTDTHITGTEPLLGHLQVNALDGNDKVAVDPAVSTLIGVNVDLGLGQH